MADTLADTFLPPIEQPQGLLMKLAYYFTRRQFGKVLTPLKVHSARLPPAFGLFYAKVSRLDEKLELPASEHFYNMTNIGLNIHSDMLCDISRKRRN